MATPFLSAHCNHLHIPAAEIWLGHIAAVPSNTLSDVNGVNQQQIFHAVFTITCIVNNEEKAVTSGLCLAWLSQAVCGAAGGNLCCISAMVFL